MLPVDLGVDPEHVGELVEHDPRLVVEAKLVAVDGLPQFGLELDPGDGAPARFLVEQLERERPRSLARYIAASASRITVSGGTEGSATIAIPTLTVMVNSTPSTSIGRLAAWQIRSAISTTSRSEVRSSNRNVNSSPPKRATVSIGRSIALRRPPNAISTRSPTA